MAERRVGRRIAVLLRLRVLTDVLAAALVAAACTLGVTVASSTSASTVTPIGRRVLPVQSTVPPGAVDKVLVFVEKNHSFDQMKARMP